MKLAVMIILYSSSAAASMILLARIWKRAFPGISLWIPLSLSGILFAFPLAGALIPDGPACRFFQRWGNVFLGFILYFFGVLLAVSLFFFLLFAFRRAFRKRLPKLSRRSAVLLLAGSFLISLSLNAYGFCAAHDVRVTRYEIAKERLSQKEPLKIVLIADLHIGVNSSPRLYMDMVEKINHEEPDLVLVAGDIVTSSFGAVEKPQEYSEILKGIRAGEGVYAVYGNHDVDEPLLGGFTYMGAEHARRDPALPAFLEACGWKVLEDETVLLPARNGLLIAGRRDLSRPGDGLAARAGLDDLLAGIGAEAPILLLEHEPAELDALSEKGVDLAVCGHTHDGQIFPGNLIVRLLSEQAYGLRMWDDTAVVVTSGIGFYGPPIRVGTISEITVIDLK